MLGFFRFLYGILYIHIAFRKTLPVIYRPQFFTPYWYSRCISKKNIVNYGFPLTLAAVVAYISATALVLAIPFLNPTQPFYADRMPTLCRLYADCMPTLRRL